MNRFTRLTSGRSSCLAVAGVALVSLVASAAIAQRVQFPTPAQPVQATIQTAPSPYMVPAPPAYGTAVSPPPGAVSPYTVTPGSPFPPPAPGGYPATPFAPAPMAAPGVPYSAPAVGPPPAFDPYAVGNSVSAAPPPGVPYSYSPPPIAPPPAQPSSIYPNGLPFQYQPPPPGAPTTPGEGYWEKTQRFLQELSLEQTYLFAKHDDPTDFGWNRTEVSSTFAFPLWYNIETPLLVTPGFAFNWLQGPITDPPPPIGPDLPPRVYDAYLDFAWYPRVTEYLGGELGFRTGVWSDFSFWDTDSIRFLGRGLANVSITPQFDILFGAVYLDRLNVKILPAGGVYFRPTPEWDLYLVFPNPKIRNFIAAIGNTKWFWYAAGEYGGGTWTVKRQFVPQDQFDYNDIRVSGGLEFETQTMIRGHVEVGYVFDRQILFRSGMPGEFNPDATFMARGGIDF